MFLILEKGGIIMGIILVLSVAATVIILERLLFFRKIRLDEEKFINRLRAALEERRFQEAISICENSSSPWPIS
jgi:biopolymer transport protein ExbB